MNPTHAACFIEDRIANVINMVSDAFMPGMATNRPIEAVLGSALIKTLELISDMHKRVKELEGDKDE